MKKDVRMNVLRRRQLTDSTHGSLLAELQAEIAERTLPRQFDMHSLSSKNVENVVTPSTAPVPDCLTCGACCQYFQRVLVDEDDTTPRSAFWKISEDLSGGREIRYSMLKRDPASGSCASLEGRIGESVSCSIYESRPRQCRLFEAGSDRCHEVRRMYGMEPQLTAGQVAEANSALEKVEAERAELWTVKRVFNLPIRNTRFTAFVAVLGNKLKRVIGLYIPALGKLDPSAYVGELFQDALNTFYIEVVNKPSPEGRGRFGVMSLLYKAEFYDLRLVPGYSEEAEQVIAEIDKKLEHEEEEKLVSAGVSVTGAS